MTANQTNRFRELVRATKGKFFSVTFVKKSTGEKRVANGKDKYFRLLVGGKDGALARVKAENVPFVDRNKDAWISAHEDSVVHFKCGKIEVTL